MFNSDDQYKLRRVVYLLVSALLALLGASGIMNAEQIESWTDAINEFLTAVFPFLAAVSSLIAAAKTHRGSDDPTTKQDVIEAQKPVPAPAPAPAPANGNVLTIDTLREVVAENIGRRR